MRADLPTGTVTFLLTDVEDSTKRLHELGAERYAAALGEHRRVVREAYNAHGGVEVDTQGDAFFLAFPTATGAVAAAAEIAHGLTTQPLQARLGLHTGTALVTDEGYVGDDVHLAARVMASGHGGQVLVSGATAALVPEGLLDLGEHRLKDIGAPVPIFQLGDRSFPPLRTISNTNLPRPASSFVGREHELAEILERVGGGARLLTLTGPGGSGKTRLAVEAAASLVPDFRAGVYWVGLAPLRDPALVTETISRALGARNGLAEHIGDRELLVLLDNLEQVIAAAPELSPLLAACPNLTLLVTSRELLRVEGEVEYPVLPLAEPEAVALFCERAQLEPTAEIAELCARLDSLPLAVELAAARTKALSPVQILERLSQRLDLLRGGRGADPRQQTLRATVEWSYDLLSAEEQQLFRRLSVFAGGCTLAAAEQVAGAEIDPLQSLVEKNLLRFGGERYWLLETIREFAAERLDAAEAEAVRRRHRAFVVALAEASARDLHNVNESATSARLAPDYANVRAAVSHALAAGEPDDAGRVIGALYPFLISHGNLGEAQEWVAAVLSARDRLSPRTLAATLAGGGEIARFAGDLGFAIELKEQELASEEAGAGRPDGRAGTLADLSEIALDQNDYARARMYAEESAAAGGGPRVALCLAELALRTGDLRSAEAHGLEGLAGFEEGAFNHACALEILGETARRGGDEGEAESRFTAALRSFAALRDGGGTADCLDGLARLAAVRDAARAGRLLGAAERLRETRGRRPIRADLPLPEAPASTREEGRSLTFDEAVAYALASESSPAGR